MRICILFKGTFLVFKVEKQHCFRRFKPSCHWKEKGGAWEHVRTGPPSWKTMWLSPALPFYRWRNWVSDTLIDLAMATQVPDGSQNAILDLFTLKVCYLSMAPAASSCILLYTQSLQEHLCYRRCSTGVFGSIDSHLLILSPLCGIPSTLSFKRCATLGKSLL